MKVSVVIPVYNSEKYIEKCLESVINQTYKNIEIIIINDGSKDNTGKLVKRYKEKDERIIYLEQKNNGVSSARNKAIQVSSGEYIIFVDSDDTVDKDYVKLLLSTIEKESLDIVACGYTDISVYGIIKLNDFYKDKTLIGKNDFIKYIFTGVGGTLWGKIFKSKIIKENNIKMNEEIFMCEDMLFVLKYATKCTSFGAIKEHLYNYNRINDNSISSKINFAYYNNLITVIKLIEDILVANKYSKDFIDNILSQRVKSISFNLAIMQHDSKHNYKIKDKLNNIKIILDNNYYKRYKNIFNSNSLKEKILLNLFKQRNIKAIYYYSYFVHCIEVIKFKIKVCLGMVGG